MHAPFELVPGDHRDMSGGCGPCERDDIYYLETVTFLVRGSCSAVMLAFISLTEVTVTVGGRMPLSSP